jgi:hypothetical protein
MWDFSGPAHSCPFQFDLHDPDFCGRVMAEAAPAPIGRLGAQAPLDRVVVYVAQHFLEVFYGHF